jgi:hypothetical protein
MAWMRTQGMRKQDCFWCVVYCFRKKSARSSSNNMWKFQASKLIPACSLWWSFLSLDGGFKFQPCVISLSNLSKTSQETSIYLYRPFTLENRQCCVEIRNVRWWHYDASWTIILHDDWHWLHKPFLTHGQLDSEI